MGSLNPPVPAGRVPKRVWQSKEWEWECGWCNALATPGDLSLMYRLD